MLTVLRTGKAPFLLSRCSFATGRSCLVHLIDRYLPDHIYMPMMVPEGVVVPFEAAGLPISHYDLNDDLSPNVESLRAKLEMHSMTQRRVLVIVIFYFGYTMPTAEAAALARVHGGLLLVDSTHSLYNPDALASDLVLYSLNKILSVPDGATLVSTTPQADLTEPKDLKPLDDSVVNAYHDHLSLNRIIRKVGAWNYYSRAAQEMSDRAYDEYYRGISSDMKPRKMSEIAQSAYSHLDFEKISTVRRENARKIVKHLRKRSLYRLDAPDFALPINCSRYGRQDTMNAFQCEGILPSMLGKFWRTPHPAGFWLDHLLLPVDQDLSPAEVNKIAMVARRWT